MPMLNNPLLKKITVFLVPLLVFLLWEWWLAWPRALIEIGFLVFVLVALEIWYLTLRPVAVTQLQVALHRKEFWRFFLMPGFFILAINLFLLIVDNSFWQQVIIVATALLLLMILQNLFDRFHQASRYPANSFESLSGIINSISLFLLVTILYSFSTFLDLSIWFLALLFLGTTTLLTYQTMWIAGIEIKRSWFYILIIDLVLVELFWVMFFLPNTFYVKALIVTILYYLAVNLSRNYLINLLNRKMIWRYLIIGGIILLLVLLTAQWL